MIINNVSNMIIICECRHTYFNVLHYLKLADNEKCSKIIENRYLFIRHNN